MNARIAIALFLVITATFFMVRFVPGGPFTAEKAVTPEILRNWSVALVTNGIGAAGLAWLDAPPDRRAADPGKLCPL